MKNILDFNSFLTEAAKFGMFGTTNNNDLVHLIVHFANKLKSYSERDMKDHQHYIDAIEGLDKLKLEIAERIEHEYRMEQTPTNKMAGDILKDIFREEGIKIHFSVGMWQTLLKTIDKTLEQNKLVPVIEDGKDYVLYDEEKEFLQDLFKKYDKEK